MPPALPQPHPICARSVPCCCHSRKIFLSFPCSAPSIIAAVAANLISPVYSITDAVPCVALTYHLISSCCTFPMILVRITPSAAPILIYNFRFPMRYISLSAYLCLSLSHFSSSLLCFPREIISAANSSVVFIRRQKISFGFK